MNENIDLTKIFKDCPEGEQFWSPMLGYVKLFNINQERKIVTVILETDATWDINANGTISIGNMTSPDIMLYPSKDQHDWSKFSAPWLKKEKFDPKTLKPFDKVLVFDSDRPWTPLMFSYLEYTLNYPRMQCFDFVARKVIPYNKETEHLLGTHNEAPDFYRYWED